MTGSEQHEHGIHGQIGRLARRLHDAARTEGMREPQAVLEEVTRAAVDVLPGVDHAGVTLVRRKSQGRRAELESTAATGQVPQRVDQLQHDTGEGPCFEAVWEHATMRVDDVTTDTRWPRFAAAVAEQTPVLSALSIQLFVTHTELGALNLYSEAPHGFDDPPPNIHPHSRADPPSPHVARRAIPGASEALIAGVIRAVVGCDGRGRPQPRSPRRAACGRW